MTSTTTQPTITVLLPMIMSDSYTPQKTEHASLHRPTVALVTELLQLPAADYGTVYHYISEMRIYCTVSLGNY